MGSPLHGREELARIHRRITIISGVKMTEISPQGFERIPLIIDFRWSPKP
jgi:hypothetical protein